MAWPNTISRTTACAKSPTPNSARYGGDSCTAVSRCALEELHPANQESVSSRLAAHYEAAGMAEPAIHHYVEAAEVARHRYADAEAGDLLRRALVLCRNFPETVRRDQQELKLLVTLGPVLVTTLGYSAPEVGELYERALLLSRRLGDTEHVFPVLSGAWVFHVVRGQLEASRELAQECLDLANGADSAGLSVMGHFILGSCNFHLGRLESSKKHLDQALTAFSGGSNPALGIICGTGYRRVLPVLSIAGVVAYGRYAAEAFGKSEEALAAARQVSHPFSMAIALDYAAMLHVFDRDIERARIRAEEAAAVCRKHGFTYYLSVAEILAGWAMAMAGDAQPGLARLRQGLETFKASGAELRLPFYHGLLAEACARAGQLGEALANISSRVCFPEQEWRGLGGGGVTSHSRRSVASQRKSATSRGQLPRSARHGATCRRSACTNSGQRTA